MFVAMFAGSVRTSRLPWHWVHPETGRSGEVHGTDMLDVAGAALLAGYNLVGVVQSHGVAAFAGGVGNLAGRAEANGKEACASDDWLVTGFAFLAEDGVRGGDWPGGERPAHLFEAEMPIQATAAMMATSASLNCQVRIGEPFLK